MSAISARIVPVERVPGEGANIELNASVFSAGVVAFLLGDATVNQVRDFLNTHITEDNSGYPVLTAAEEADIGGGGTSMKSHYDGLPNANARQDYLFRLTHYPLQLQIGSINESQFDGLMGL